MNIIAYTDAFAQDIQIGDQVIVLNKGHRKYLEIGKAYTVYHVKSCGRNSACRVGCTVGCHSIFILYEGEGYSEGKSATCGCVLADKYGRKLINKG